MRASQPNCSEYSPLCITLARASLEELLVEWEWSRQNYYLSKRLDENIMPKNTAYFYEDKSIVEQMPCSEKWKGMIYRVVTENLIPFVADTGIRNERAYIISNRRYLKKLFEAILLDEWNAGYADQQINALIEDPKFVSALKKDIRNMFYKASLFDWNRRHHMTVNANVSRLLRKSKKDTSMGYNGISEDRWDCLLREGYQAVFLMGNSKAIEMLNSCQGENSIWENMFAKLRDQIITVDMKEMDLSDEEKTEFRKSFERMYDKASGHEYNPFSVEMKERKFETQDEKKKFLADVCDFTKGIERDEILDPFVKIFQNAIQDYITKQNQKRMDLLLKYRSDFKEKIHGVIDEIETIVGKGNTRWILKMMQEIIDMRE
jgi:hypothetical protein